MLRYVIQPATLYDLTCSPGAWYSTYAQMMQQQQFNHDVFAAEQDLAAEARGGVNMTRVEALRLKMQRWQLSPTRARLGFAAYPNLNPTFTPARTRT